MLLFMELHDDMMSVTNGNRLIEFKFEITDQHQTSVKPK